MGQPQGPSAEPNSRGAKAIAQTAQVAQILEQAKAFAQQRAASIDDEGMIQQTPLIPGQLGARNLQAEDLVPRQPFPKIPSDQIRVPLVASGRLIVKFLDDVKARVQPGGVLVSLSGRDMTPAREIIENGGVELTAAILLPAESIAAIEGKAAANSGRAQPDLAGLMYVSTDGAVPMQIAQALNELDIVEFVQVEPTYVIKSPGGPTGACCLPDLTCLVVDQATCTAMGGVYNGDDTDCPDPDNPTCGDFCTGGCFEIHNTLVCDDEDCCEMVCEIDPFCCDPDETWPGRGPPRWDEWCVQHALALCGGFPFGVCGDPNAGPCEEAHPETVGCSNSTCCEAVCDQNPQCCNIAWDAFCASAALSLCTIADPNADTPSFVAAQGYLSHLSYIEEYGFLPLDLIPGLNFDVDGFLLDGYQGQGYNLQGLWEFAEFLVGNGIGDENLARGKSTKVGIVEFSAFVHTAIGPAAPYRHEDLHGKVIPEPGQTPIIVPGSANLSGHHGTATLGIVGAIDHDANGNEEPDGLSPDESRAEEVGIVGIAPEADLYFFPIVSVEEPGGRLIGAIANALILFDPGDVLSFSIGPGGCGILTSGQAEWTMIRLASDAGITCCISAGNDCCDLSENAEAGSIDGTTLDSGAIIVGACYPGFGSFNRYCRLGFSNHCLACGDDDGVHISAWGTSVATLGYGSMFFPDGDLNRSYHNGFGGTSAAAPQVAGIVANLQGVAKQFYGIPILTSQIRFLVSNNGYGQCGFLEPANRPGNGDDRPCIGDWDFNAPLNNVTSGRVGYTEVVTAAVSIISSGFFDCDSLLQAMSVLRGTQLYGNLNSLRCPDGQILRVKSLYTEPMDNIHLGIVYLGFGQITDLLIVTRPEIADPQSIALLVQSRMTSGGTAASSLLIFGELYDFVENRWTNIGFFLPEFPGAVNLYTFIPNGTASAFIRDGDNLVLARAWTLTLGGNFGGFGGGAPNNTYVMEHDWFAIDVGGFNGDPDP